MIEVVILKGPNEQAQGLIGMKPIPANTFFVFPNIRPNTYFHSQGVLEPFDIAFIDKGGNPLLVTTVTPPNGLIKVPVGTDSVIETKAGMLRGAGLGDAPACADTSSEIALYFPILIIAAGAGIGLWAFKKQTPMGRLLLGAGGSMIGAGLVVFLQKALSIPITKA